MKSKIFLVACLVALFGWFGAQGVMAQNQTGIMQDSGFKQWNIDTPQEKTFFNQFPQGKFITYQKGDKVVHVHKDPQTGMVCAGDDTALQGYMQKCQNAGITPKPRENADQQDDPMFWNMWADERGLG